MKNPFKFLDKGYSEDSNLRMTICMSGGGGGDSPRYVCVVNRGGIWPGPYLYFTGYDTEWGNFQKEIVEEVEGKVEASNCIFFFLWGKEFFILRLNHIRLGYSKCNKPQ